MATCLKGNVVVGSALLEFHHRFTFKPVDLVYLACSPGPWNCDVPTYMPTVWLLPREASMIRDI